MREFATSPVLPARAVASCVRWLGRGCFGSDTGGQPGALARVVSELVGRVRHAQARDDYTESARAAKGARTVFSWVAPAHTCRRGTLPAKHALQQGCDPAVVISICSRACFDITKTSKRPHTRAGCNCRERHQRLGRRGGQAPPGQHAKAQGKPRRQGHRNRLCQTQ